MPVFVRASRRARAYVRGSSAKTFRRQKTRLAAQPTPGQGSFYSVKRAALVKNEPRISKQKLRAISARHRAQKATYARGKYSGNHKFIG